MNLLKETLDDMRHAGQSPADVVFIGSRDGEYACTWDEFTKLADVEYDDGYGGQRVADDLTVRFADGGWLERHEYDGSERWEYRRAFAPAASPKRIERLVEDTDYGDAYEGLAAMHEAAL